MGNQAGEIKRNSYPYMLWKIGTKQQKGEKNYRLTLKEQHLISE